jgi:hypothetical protein
MKSRSHFVYLAIAVGALASATLQPNEAIALEQGAVHLGAALWPEALALPASDAALPHGNAWSR